MASIGTKNSCDFPTLANSGNHAGATTDIVTRPGMKLRDVEVEYEGRSGQKNAARASPSTKVPATNKVTPPLVTLLVSTGYQWKKH